jgi:autotransporter-associated beta strand protein
VTSVTASSFTYTAAVAGMGPGGGGNMTATHLTRLTIAGPLSDLGSGHNLVKEGKGIVDLTNANTYRGSTTIQDGVLRIENAQALGTGPAGVADDSTAGATISTQNTSTGEFGTLQILGPVSGNGITVVNKLLILAAGAGFNGYGSVDNLQGFNTWTGNVILGNSPGGPGTDDIRADGADPHYTFTLTGVVSDPNATPPGYHQLNKTGAGVLVLTNSNSYLGATTVSQGTLEIEDSQALGPQSKTNGTSVAAGATLELAVDNIADSLNGTRNSLTVYDPLTISGSGDTGVGALYSASGINTYFGTVTLGGPASIGVARDPNPSNTAAYFTQDFSLTIEPPGGGGSSPLVGGSTLTKIDNGQLILPVASIKFTGNVTIASGWITVGDNDSLGSEVTTVSQVSQPLVTIQTGAALHLKAAPGANLNLHQNFDVIGQGIAHPFSEINFQGAIENVEGVNTITGNIFLRGAVGIGVEKVFGPSQLSLLGTQTQNVGGATGIISIPTQNATGGSTESDNIIPTGQPQGTVTVHYNSFYVPDSFDVYYGVNGAGGIWIGGTGPVPGTQVSGSGTLTIPYAPIGGFSTDTVEIVVDLGGGPSGTAWTYSATITPKAVAGGTTNSLAKLGSGMLTLQGNNITTGSVDITQGVLLDQNNTGLGAGFATTSVTTVEQGAALALANDTAYNNGLLEGGISVHGESLVVNTNPLAQIVTLTG